VALLPFCVSGDAQIIHLDGTASGKTLEELQRPPKDFFAFEPFFEPFLDDKTFFARRQNRRAFFSKNLVLLETLDDDLDDVFCLDTFLTGRVVAL
jgi:hypothetical protein